MGADWPVANREMNLAWSGRVWLHHASFPTILLYLADASSDRAIMVPGSLKPFSNIANRSGGTGDAFRSIQKGSSVNNSSK